MSDQSPGWDQKAIHKIAKDHYSGLKELFRFHGWEWLGSKAMSKVSTLIANEYETIERFQYHHNNRISDQHKQSYGSLVDNLRRMNAWLVPFEKGMASTWEPKHWGVDGFSDYEQYVQFLEKAHSGALFIAYDSEVIPPRILGIYQYDTSQIVDFREYISREAFDSMSAQEYSDWKFVFRAVRCWTAPKSLNLDPQTLFPVEYEETAKFDAVHIENLESLTKLTEINWITTSFYQPPDKSDPFARNPSVWIKAFYGYDPESWGCVGYNQPGRIDTLISSTTNPFIMAIWVTFDSNDPAAGKLAGFMEVTHEKGRRADFIAPFQDDAHEKGKWEYSLRASRAWEILPEFQPKIRDFYPDMQTGKRERASGRWAEKLPDQYVEKLKALPRREVKVYGSDAEITPDIVFPPTKGGFVKSGPGRRNGFEVGEPRSLEKELYILKLNGDVDAFLGRNGHGQSIYKIGLSISPETRKATLNSAIPNGQFYWSVERTTSRDGDPRYPNHEIAEAGEMAMKEYLGGIKNAHLGGEFYLASEKAIKAAWKLGKSKALAMQEEQ